jgi:RNA polymerase sigma-70 factor, ECF subfamily
MAMTDQNEPTADSEVARRAREGDAGAFAILMQQYRPLATALAWRMLGDEAAVQDAVQEGFVSAWRGIRRFDPSLRFGTWLYRIVMNRCLDMLRAETRRRRWFHREDPLKPAPDDPPCVDPTPDLRTEGADLARLVRRHATLLPPTQRAVFVLRDLQDLSIRDAADVLGLSEGAVKTNLCLARKFLRERLAPLLERTTP